MSISYGYVRVSTKEQNEDRQMIAMHQFGVLPDKIYLDKQSGNTFLLISNPARISTDPNTRNYSAYSRKVMYYTSSVSTGLDEIMRKY